MRLETIKEFRRKLLPPAKEVFFLSGIHNSRISYFVTPTGPATLQKLTPREGTSVLSLPFFVGCPLWDEHVENRFCERVCVRGCVRLSVRPEARNWSIGRFRLTRSDLFSEERFQRAHCFLPSKRPICGRVDGVDPKRRLPPVEQIGFRGICSNSISCYVTPTGVRQVIGGSISETGACLL